VACPGKRRVTNAGRTTEQRALRPVYAPFEDLFERVATTGPEVPARSSARNITATDGFQESRFAIPFSKTCGVMSQNRDDRPFHAIPTNRPVTHSPCHTGLTPMKLDLLGLTPIWLDFPECITRQRSEPIGRGAGGGPGKRRGPSRQRSLHGTHRAEAQPQAAERYPHGGRSRNPELQRYPHGGRSRNFPGFPWISLDFPGFPGINRD